MEEKQLLINYKVYDTIEELDLQDKQLLIEAKEASKKAYAPYSNFFVGAAILLENGKIITGNNQENAAFPSGLCAERVAVFAAASHFPDEIIRKIAIYANTDKFEITNPISPCGACRQVLSEYEIKQNSDLKIILMSEKSKIVIFNGVKDILPFMFHVDELKNS